jgi:hypothetical protein
MRVRGSGGTGSNGQWPSKHECQISLQISDSPRAFPYINIFIKLKTQPQKNLIKAVHTTVAMLLGEAFF